VDVIFKYMQVSPTRAPPASTETKRTESLK